MAAHERVAVRQRGHHSAGLHGERSGADPWIDPHDPVSQAREALHLTPHQHRVATLPAVGENHDHGAACHATTSVPVVELSQRVADPGPARPIGRGGGSALDRTLRVARSQRAGQTGQPCGEHERLGVRTAAGGAGEELQVRACVGLHRAGDVAEQYESPAGDASVSTRETNRLASRAKAGAQCPPQVDPLPVAPFLVAARASQRSCELQTGHQPVELRELVRLERIEALASEQLLVACHRQRHLDLGEILVRFTVVGRRQRDARAQALPIQVPGRGLVLGPRPVVRR